MLLDVGEFVEEIATGKIHWIEKIDRAFVTIAWMTYENKKWKKDFANLTKRDFYECYQDIKKGVK